MIDKTITNMNEVQDALKKLHQIGPQTIAISSTELNNSKLTTVVSATKG